MQDQIRLWELEKNRMKSQEGRVSPRHIRPALTLFYRLPLHGFRLPSRLRMGPRLRQEYGRCSLGESLPTVLFRKLGGTRKYSRIHRKEERRQRIGSKQTVAHDPLYNYNTLRTGEAPSIIPWGNRAIERSMSNPLSTPDIQSHVSSLRSCPGNAGIHYA